jgi:hypothetical protein
MTLDIAATQNQAALELTGKIAANPALAKPILKILKQLGGDVEKLQSLDLSALVSVQEALPKSQLSTEQTLRAENRIQDNAAILANLGFKGDLPLIPAELLEECARTSGTLVLKFKTTILDYQANLNAALGSKEHLHLSYINDRAKTLATTNEEPSWINVPNTVRVDTLGMSKARALSHVPGSATCDPMDTVLMLGFNNLQAGEQLAGFTNKWTFTNQKNTLVGSGACGFNVVVYDYFDVSGNLYVGLAPRPAPESKI